MDSTTIKHFKPDNARTGLTEGGIQGMTVIRGRGFCRPKGYMKVYRGVEYKVQFLPKIRIEIKSHNKKPCKVLNIIQKSAETGEICDRRGY